MKLYPKSMETKYTSLIPSCYFFVGYSSSVVPEILAIPAVLLRFYNMIDGEALVRSICSGTNIIDLGLHER